MNQSASELARWSTLVLVTGFVARLFFILYAPLEKGDALEYTAIATHLVTHGSFATTDFSPTMFRAPGYPSFMAGIYVLAGGASNKAVLVAQAIVGASAGLLLYRLLRRIVQEPAARLTAIGAAASPNLASLASGIYYETLLAGALVSLVYCVHRANDDDTEPAAASRFALLSGVAASASGLITPRFVVAPALAAAAILAGGHGSRNRRAWLCLAISAALLVPWTIRNYRTFGVANPSGMEDPALLLWLGAHRAASDDWRYPRLYENNMIVERYVAVLRDREHEQSRMQERTALERQVFLEALRAIRNDPLAFARDRAKNYTQLWIDRTTYTTLFIGPLSFAHRNMTIVEHWKSRHYSAVLLRATALTTFLVVPAILIAAGIVIAAARWREHAAAYLLTGWVAVTHAPIFIEHRYSVPLHPVLAIFAAIALQRVIDRLRQSRLHRVPLVQRT